MTKRSDIIDNSDRYISRDTPKGLIYTENLGWIDLGHANPAGAERLWQQMVIPHGGDDTWFEVNYHQSMSTHFAGISITTGIYRRFLVRRGLSERVLQGVALSIFMATSHQFESIQDFWPYIVLTDSGYSAEDLVSKLFGFCQAVNYADYTSFLNICLKEKAYRIWDHYGPVGEYKNKSVLPLLFPDPYEKKDNLRPYQGNLPAFMSSITPQANPAYVRELTL
ncbi:hypothetical protein P832_04447 [Enterobacter kobei]|uniref:hypothetical protein n=1 Tax=Enterobacter kobei TaxID=208224 RepID=UPI00044705D3|nr:hypothetical protein [Enterobacter kobei]EUL81813.1 hypothetical protein P827_04202 [Enterobacter kobei]KDF65959.1 hypothetical protein P832_04447 [Enterobacter kobei]